jgi:transcriptional regulator with XRE-family HTH domain
MAKIPRSRTLAAFGLNVRRCREHLGLTQERVAERADLDPTYISGIERGIRNPSLLSMARVARALGITLVDLCEGVRASAGISLSSSACAKSGFAN